MKKAKSILLVMLLSVILATNSFGNSSITDLTTNLFDTIKVAVVSLFASNPTDDCPVRTCGDCRPGMPDCRPPKD